MTDGIWWEPILKLVVAVVLGGLIGMEREAHGRPAGLRTHILVCTGSALFTLCSYAIAGNQYDPGRITAQIVTGIGFLGAGTIMRQGSMVRGLTTAASIWTVAAIGIAVAIGGQMLYTAFLASVLVFAVLNIVPNLERHLFAMRDERYLTIHSLDDQESVCRVLSLLAAHGAQLRVLGSEDGADGKSQILRLRIHARRDFNETTLGAELAVSKDVISYSWE